MKIKIGDTVIMPEPSPEDFWQFGGFSATVIDYVEETNLLIVQDQDDDTFMIEPERVKSFSTINLQSS